MLRTAFVLKRVFVLRGFEELNEVSNSSFEFADAGFSAVKGIWSLGYRAFGDYMSFLCVRVVKVWGCFLFY